MENKFIILLADRNNNIRELLRREFKLAGYEVLTAGDGREVLNILRSDELPDLVVLDLDLPMIEELKLLEKIRNRIPPLPLILHYSHGALSACRSDIAADALIEKNGNLDNLKDSVDKVIYRSYGRDRGYPVDSQGKGFRDYPEKMPETGKRKKINEEQR